VAKPDLCFPNKIEDMIVLHMAILKNPDDAKAMYYLGNLWYDKRQYDDAIECWEDSIRKDNFFPTAQRNLALAYYNKKGNPAKAALLLRKAFNLDITDSRILMELDQLNKKIQVPAQKRLELLDQYPELVEYRDDLYLERATLLNWIGNYDQAMLLIALRKFHPWEGGEGKVVEQYKISRIELAKKAIHVGEFSMAIVLLSECLVYPTDLGEGKLTGTQENDIHYLMGVAFELSGNKTEAEKYYELATKGSHEPGCAIFYNDQKPDVIFYQGLAFLKLKQEEKARQRFELLAEFGEKHLHDKVKLDYFAVSLPDLLIFDEDLVVRNTIHCRYLIGLGNLGLGEVNNAVAAFKEVLAQDCYHWGAFMHLKMINSSSLMTFKVKKI
ncbi:MAG TPA: tetratricopeptide repeat protein, partial [Bacteroidales bacterium]|nr:tetratricopeptide repeat protein [Bacteroidales bacterium]